LYDFVKTDRELPTLLKWSESFSGDDSPSTPFRVNPSLVDHVWSWMERYATDFYITVLYKPEMAATLLLIGFLLGLLAAMVALRPTVEQARLVVAHAAQNRAQQPSKSKRE